MLDTRRFKALLTLVALLGLLATPASALFMQPPSVPAERLIKNITAYLQDKPEDPEAHYLLARIHYMMFVNRLDHVRTNDMGSDKKLPRLTDERQYGKAEGQKIDEDIAIEHAKTAIASFNKALELDKDNALYHLGLAGLYEQSTALANKIDPNPQEDADKDPKLPSESQRFIASAVKHNLAAYRLGREAALAEDHVFLPFYPVAYEAGTAYLRLIQAYDLKPEDDKIVAQVKADLAAIDDKPKAITPIVFRVEGDAPRSLDDLLADNKTVRFDLDADGTAEERPWVKPDTAILVWDPLSTGKITSGQQLFGNMTFFMLFSDGYRALDSLDDNRDGQLAGDELKGLALWHDRNTNGISEAGEVSPLIQSNVRAIATGSTSKVNNLHPMNTAGLTLEDGSRRPTWDWVIPAVEAAR